MIFVELAETPAGQRKVVLKFKTAIDAAIFRTHFRLLLSRSSDQVKLSGRRAGFQSVAFEIESETDDRREMDDLPL